MDGWMPAWMLNPHTDRPTQAQPPSPFLTPHREITDDMFRLWCLAEEDLLSPEPHCAYELRDTGQGLHRVQPCPRTFHAMQVRARFGCVCRLRKGGGGTFYVYV